MHSSAKYLGGYIQRLSRLPLDSAVNDMRLEDRGTGGTEAMSSVRSATYQTICPVINDAKNDGSGVNGAQCKPNTTLDFSFPSQPRAPHKETHQGGSSVVHP